jgi:hypothetical protein
MSLGWRLGAEHTSNLCDILKCLEWNYARQRNLTSELSPVFLLRDIVSSTLYVSIVLITKYPSSAICSILISLFQYFLKKNLLNRLTCSYNNIFSYTFNSAITVLHQYATSPRTSQTLETGKAQVASEQHRVLLTSSCNLDGPYLFQLLTENFSI